MRVGFVFTLLFGVVSSQLIIPHHPLGYVYSNGSLSAPINVDVHMGPLCPDSSATFPTIKQVADHYTRDTLKLTLHEFPLPYHRQSYFTAIVRITSPSSSSSSIHHPSSSSPVSHM